MVSSALQLEVTERPQNVAAWWGQYRHWQEQQAAAELAALAEQEATRRAQTAAAAKAKEKQRQHQAAEQARLAAERAAERARQAREAAARVRLAARRQSEELNHSSRGALSQNRRGFLARLGLEGLGLAIWAGVSNQIKPTTEEVVLEDFAFETVRVDRQGAIIERSNGNAQVFSEALGNGVTLEMVLIPGGTFTMGSPSDEAMRVNNEGPQHEVTVPEFYLGKYAVTQAQWEAVMGNNPSRFKGSNRPVEQVSWRDATEFCQKLSERTGRSYRLPSEAEWEYACRAGTTTPFHFGETITTDLVNFWGYFSISYVGGPEIVYRGEFPGETTDVGSFEVANAFGLYDMHGNVFEWCEDHWHNNYEGALTDGSTWLSENDDDSHSIARGGSWDYITRECRSAYRHRDFPFQDDVIEFRVVCVAPRTH